MFCAPDTPTREARRASAPPGRRVLRPVRRGRQPQRRGGALSARAVRRGPRAPEPARRGDQAARARGGPGHARGREPARPHLHHAARPRGYPPARLRPGRRDGRDRRYRAAGADLPPRRRAGRGEAAHAGGRAHDEGARRGRGAPQAGRRRDALLRRGEEARGGGRRPVPRRAGAAVRAGAGRARGDQVEGDLRQPRADTGRGGRRRQRARVDHLEARLMASSVWFVLAVVLIALAFDFSNGFHDAANSIATVVSTRVLSPTAAVVWAAVFNFIGAFAIGTAVAQTIAKGIVNPDIMDAHVALGALLGAISWNLITWYGGLPSSSSHALMGGLAGAGISKAGFGALVLPGKWLSTILFIVVAPLMGLALALLLTVALSWALRRSLPRRVDRTFRVLQLFSAAAYSLGHGTNDAQKTMGIIVALLVAEQGRFVDFPVRALHLTDAGVVPYWIVVACGAAMGLGTVTGGWRIVRTMGQRITKLKPFGGFCAETSGAITLFIASHFGIPVSTTHTITG